MPKRLRVGATTAAVSPMAKMFGWPGTERSGCAFTRPALSVSTPSHCPAGEATTPAVHATVRLPIRWPATTTPLALTSSTLVLVRPAPRCPSAGAPVRRAARDSQEGYGEPPQRAQYALRGDQCGESLRQRQARRLAMVPAISTPAVPPPTRMKVNNSSTAQDPPGHWWPAAERPRTPVGACRESGRRRRRSADPARRSFHSSCPK